MTQEKISRLDVCLKDVCNVEIIRIILFSKVFKFYRSENSIPH